MSIYADYGSWNGSGAPSYTNHGNGANLDLLSSLSIDAWVRLRQTSLDGDSDILRRGTVSGYSFKINRNNAVLGKNIIAFSKLGVSNNYPASAIVPNGVLTHIAVTWNSATGDFKFYINGVLVQTLNDANAFVDPGAVNTYIGSITAGAGVNGFVYSLNVYNRVLSAAEILYNMNHPTDAIRRGRQLGVTQESWVGGVWKDLSPNGYDGAPTSVVLGSSNNLAGRQVSI